MEHGWDQCFRFRLLRGNHYSIKAWALYWWKALRSIKIILFHMTALSGFNMKQGQQQGWVFFVTVLSLEKKILPNLYKCTKWSTYFLPQATLKMIDKQLLSLCAISKLSGFCLHVTTFILKCLLQASSYNNEPLCAHIGISMIEELITNIGRWK